MGLLRLLTFILRLALVVMTVRIRLRPFFPYIRFSWKNRQDLRLAWGEWSAIRKLI